MLGRLLIRAALWVSISAQIALGQQADFSDHRVARVTVSNAADIQLLRGMTDDIWSHHLGADSTLDVRLSPLQYERLLASGLHHEVMIDDVQVLIDRQRAGGVGDGPFDDYMDYEAVLAYIDSLVASRPDLASTFVVGQSFEGRDIIGIRISGPGGGDKPGVLYDSCIHAREWVTVPATLYFATQLIERYDSDPQVAALVDRAEMFIVPVLNPDGYIHTWDSNRMWRKNRRPVNGGNCDGIDLNRNFGVGWGQPGSSGDPCNQTYRGAEAFSEPESRAMRDFILAHPNLVTYQDIHSYSQLLMWPWGYQSALPPDQATFDFMGTTMADLIRGVHGMEYVVGPVYTTIYPASGVTIDWAYGEAELLAFTFELRDRGQTGFLLPPEQILPNCEEVYPALFFQADYATTALRIVLPEGTPTYIDPAGGTTLRIDVSEGSEAIDPDGVRLLVRPFGEPDFTPYVAQHLGGGEFEATFPEVNCDGDVAFYVKATGLEGGEVRSPSGAPAEFYASEPGARVEFFADNFESDLGWTVENLGASSGDWQRGVPVDDPGWAYDPAGDSDGSGKCWLTQNELGNTDVDDGAVRLTSPVLDMTADELTISYDYFLRLTRPQDNTDHLLVEINSDGGAWTQIARHTSDGGLSWRNHTISTADLHAAGVTPTANMRMRFTALDANAQSIVEAGLDAFKIFNVSCQSGYTVGDMNCDGAIDAGDIEPFLVALFQPGNYSALYPGCNINTADINQDGSIDALDIEPFLDLLF
ncbi:MAG: hypothetical protein IID33_07505 [Planctomycetes bacterium]|nr:hypothetical protein [Planctomycetota bacterium]